MRLLAPVTIAVPIDPDAEPALDLASEPAIAACLRAACFPQTLVPHTAVQRNAFAPSAAVNLPIKLCGARWSARIETLLTQMHSSLQDVIRSYFKY
jgi:hypothetical protein